MIWPPALPVVKYSMVRAWQYFRAIGKIGGVNAVVNRMVGHGNSHRRGLPEFIATPNGNALPFTDSYHVKQ